MTWPARRAAKGHGQENPLRIQTLWVLHPGCQGQSPRTPRCDRHTKSRETQPGSDAAPNRAPEHPPFQPLNSLTPLGMGVQGYSSTRLQIFGAPLTRLHNSARASGMTSRPYADFVFARSACSVAEGGGSPGQVPRLRVAASPKTTPHSHPPTISQLRNPG
jgi:hypothetical protein